MTGPCFPRVNVARSANMELPVMLGVRMGETRGSCATGYDRHTLVRTAGEALERQITFARLPATRLRHRLAQLDRKIAPWFRDLFGISAQPDLEEHAFSCVKAHHIRDDSPVIMPEILFTLAPHPDQRFMPYRDSSGCAIHTDPAQARRTAIAELAERQALTLFWYFGHINHVTGLSGQSLEGVQCTQTFRIFDWLSRPDDATVLLFDISAIPPWRSILAIYVNPGGPVYFAAGGSANENLSEAVKKAVMELYQAYVLVFQNLGREDFAGDLSESTDDITRDYLTFNNPDCARMFLDMSKNNMKPLDAFQELPDRKGTQGLTDIFIFQRLLSFGPTHAPLTHVSAMCVPGFALMTIPGAAGPTDLQAAAFHGYERQIRTGPVPFA